MRTFPLLLAAVTALSAVTPGAAQMAKDSMSSDQMSGKMSSHSMSKADMMKMKSCKKMSASAMAADSGCAALMQAHPDMMKGHGAMASHG